MALHTSLMPGFLRARQERLQQELLDQQIALQKFHAGMQSPYSSLPPLTSLKGNVLRSCPYCQSESEGLSHCKNCGAPRKVN